MYLCLAPAGDAIAVHFFGVDSVYVDLVFVVAPTVCVCNFVSCVLVLKCCPF